MIMTDGFIDVRMISNKWQRKKSLQFHSILDFLVILCLWSFWAWCVCRVLVIFFFNKFVANFIIVVVYSIFCCFSYCLFFYIFFRHFSLTCSLVSRRLLRGVAVLFLVTTISVGCLALMKQQEKKPRTTKASSLWPLSTVYNIIYIYIRCGQVWKHSFTIFKLIIIIFLLAQWAWWACVKFLDTLFFLFSRFVCLLNSSYAVTEVNTRYCRIFLHNFGTMTAMFYSKFRRPH